jgi:hypothetical protein
VAEPSGALVRSVVARLDQAQFHYGVRELEAAIAEFIAIRYQNVLRIEHCSAVCHGSDKRSSWG